MRHAKTSYTCIIFNSFENTNTVNSLLHLFVFVQIPLVAFPKHPGAQCVRVSSLGLTLPTPFQKICAPREAIRAKQYYKLLVVSAKSYNTLAQSI